MAEAAALGPGAKCNVRARILGATTLFVVHTQICVKLSSALCQAGHTWAASDYISRLYRTYGRPTCHALGHAQGRPAGPPKKMQCMYSSRQASLRQACVKPACVKLASSLRQASSRQASSRQGRIKLASSQLASSQLASSQLASSQLASSQLASSQLASSASTRPSANSCAPSSTNGVFGSTKMQRLENAIWGWAK